MAKKIKPKRKVSTKMKVSELKKDARISLRINKDVKDYLSTKGISFQEILDSFINKELASIEIKSVLQSHNSKKPTKDN